MFSIKQTSAFKNWVAKLRDKKAKAIIAARIIRVSEGLLGDTATVGGDVSELRVHYGPGYRVYFTKRGKDIIILLCGGDKASQSRDIMAAKVLAAEWREGNG